MKYIKLTVGKKLIIDCFSRLWASEKKKKGNNYLFNCLTYNLNIPGDQLIKYSTYRKRRKAKCKSKKNVDQKKK